MYAACRDKSVLLGIMGTIANAVRLCSESELHCLYLIAWSGVRLSVNRARRAKYKYYFITPLQILHLLALQFRPYPREFRGAFSSRNLYDVNVRVFVFDAFVST